MAKTRTRHPSLLHCPSPGCSKPPNPLLRPSPNEPPFPPLASFCASLNPDKKQQQQKLVIPPGTSPSVYEANYTDVFFYAKTLLPALFSRFSCQFFSTQLFVGYFLCLQSINIDSALSKNFLQLLCILYTRGRNQENHFPYCHASWLMAKNKPAIFQKIVSN